VRVLFISDFRASAGIAADRLLVTCIGRVAHEKNIAFLVRVFAEVVRSVGALVVPEERDAFAAAVVRVLSDARLRRELSERGRIYARSWCAATMAARLAQLYSELCNVSCKVPAAV
jgi:glycosyltransferase involved in cell wall biosynthesis